MVTSMWLTPITNASGSSYPRVVDRTTTDRPSTAVGRERRLRPSICIAIGLVLLAAAPSTYCARAALLGDVDGDGKVTVRDAVRLLQVVAHRLDASGRDRLLGDLWPPHSDGQ